MDPRYALRGTYRLKITFALLALVALAAVPAMAVGFRNPEQGAASMGQGEAFVAQADDPSALTHNPAGVVQLEGKQLSLGLTTFFPSTTRTDPATGEEEDLKDETHLVPLLYYTDDLGGQKNFVAGIGITSPFGLSSEWDREGFARYVATFSELVLLNVNPTVSWFATEDLAVGVGLDYYTSEIILEKQVNWGLFGGSDGESELDGDGDGLGWNAGLLYRPTPVHTFGLSYRSSVSVDYSGTLTMRDISGSISGIPLSTAFGGTSYSSGANAEVTFPPMATVGYAYRPDERWKVEFDIDWTGWSTFEEVFVEYDETDPSRLAILNAGNPMRRDWDDIIVYQLGAEYAATDQVKLRFGYDYVESPVPDETFEPSIPGADRHGLTVGVGYDAGRYVVDVAYMALLYRDRDVDNAVGDAVGPPFIDGRYESSMHIVGVTVTWQF